MATPRITRRAFLRTSLAGAAGAALPRDAFRAPRARPAAAPWRRRGPVRITYNYCDMCPWRCGVVVQSVAGRVVKIDGNPADPKSRGMLCARGQGGVSFLNDPDRLTRPLIRTGPRGTWEFREASWEEALDLVAQKMLAIKETHGQEAVAFIGHTSGDFWFTDHLAQAWGSPNAAKPSMSLCTSPREEAALLTFGRAIGNHEPVDWEQIRAVALIGGHIGEDSRNTLMQEFADAVARGAEVVVVDPRFSTAAMKATRWLQIRPGADTALLLAWANVLIAEGLYDTEYIERWATGFAALAEHVRELTPEWAAPITDLPAEAIRESARALGRAAPQAAIMPGRHVVWYGNDTQRMRAVYIVNALLGAYGRPGGLYLSKAPYIEEYPHAPYAVVGGAGG